MSETTTGDEEGKSGAGGSGGASWFGDLVPRAGLPPPKEDPAASGPSDPAPAAGGGGGNPGGAILVCAECEAIDEGSLPHTPHSEHPPSSTAPIAPMAFGPQTDVIPTPDAPAAPPRYVPAVPTKLPETGDRVRYVLRKLGAGAEHYPKVRGATVTEAWEGSEKHPSEAWKRKKIGRQPTVTGPDGLPVLGDDGQPIVPLGLVNLEIHLDGHGRKDLNPGHNKYEGHVHYDPKKAPGTWHWPGE